MIVFCSVPDKKLAKTIAKELLKARVAACVDIIKGAKSLYWWQGEICEEKECKLIIKSRSTLFDELKEIITKLHPYEVPEIIALKEEAISENYGAWLNDTLKRSDMFISTRTKAEQTTLPLSEALLNPSAAFGGLYVPIEFPLLDEKFFEKALDLSYAKLALVVIEKFGFDISSEVFERALKRYALFDDTLSPVAINRLDENLYINELYHGPTRAFKDMALQPFGSILNSLAQQNDKNYLIMCATSGDTGPATLNTFENSKRIKVVCLYPSDGTSEVQKLQMINTKAKNELVIGIKGNFDDAQRALKTLLKDDEFKEELSALDLNLSAANSVNFGRILFQIIYHLYAYVDLVRTGRLRNAQSFDIIVPSGNFGNALGAYYAKKMGAKIGKIKIASNSNNVLTELFQDGIYDIRNKKLIPTISPAMDILISSNVERLLFDKFGSARTSELLENLEKNGFYKLTNSELLALQEDFVADYCSDEECCEYIKTTLSKSGQLIDPHTANCLKMVDSSRLNLITSTADWVKFTPSMIRAIRNKECEDEKEEMLRLASDFNGYVPSSILSLFGAKATQNLVVEVDEIKNTILEWIKR